MPDPVLALDIGGTKIRAALVHGAEVHGADPAGAADASPGPAGALPSPRVMSPRLEHVAQVPTPASEGPEAILGAALELAERVRDGAAIRAVGISSAGVIDTARGLVTHATDSLARWAGTDISGPTSQRFGVPVRVLNDVHAHGIGEARFGVGRDRASLLLVAVGTGIGGCHVLDGSALLGSRGAAGHVGHLAVPEAEGVPCPCGRVGHLEGLASGPGVVRLAQRLRAETADSAPSNGPPLTDGHSLARAAAGGDPAALEAYRIAGFATGRVIGGLLNALDVEVIAVTGGVAEVEGPWRAALEAGIAHEAMDVVASIPVMTASAGTHAALLGAAARALDDLVTPTLPLTE